MTRVTRAASQRPALAPGMSVADFRSYYWRKDELVRFARRLGLSTRGHKPALGMRIERRLRGAADGTEQEGKSVKGLRDSGRPLSRETRVVHYKSDTRTRAFFQSEIGPEFHFTYHLNQWRLTREDTGNLTYGDLIDEWLAERDRRQDSAYQARLPAQGEYNLFVRGFFADPANKGRSLADAASAWNSVKFRKGGRRYRSRSMDPETE